MCSIAALNICKEYLNMATVEIIILTPDKELNILMILIAFLCHHIQELCTFKMVQFFWPNVYVFIRVYTRTKIIVKIAQETPELQSKTKRHVILWLAVYTCRCTGACRAVDCVWLTCVSDVMTLTWWWSATTALLDRSPSTAVASCLRWRWAQTTWPRFSSSVDRRPYHSQPTRSSTLSASVPSSPSSLVRN